MASRASAPAGVRLTFTLNRAWRPSPRETPAESPSAQPASRSLASRLPSPSWPSRWAIRSAGLWRYSATGSGTGNRKRSWRLSRTDCRATRWGSVSASARGSVISGAVSPRSGMAAKRSTTSASSSSSGWGATSARCMTLAS